MSEDTLFPPYIARPEEEQIRQRLAQVRRKARAGWSCCTAGGIGKTYLVREMARAGAHDEAAAWVGR